MISSPSSNGNIKKANTDVQPVRLPTSETMQEKNKEDLFESYTGMMSHEFQTPLQTALMLIDLILNENPSELAIRYLKAMKTSLIMLLYLVSDILDMKAMMDEKFFAISGTFCPIEAFNQVIEATQSQASSKRINLKLKFVKSTEHKWEQINTFSSLVRIVDRLEEVALPEFMKGDKQRLQQILINMIKNAIKFTRTGIIMVVASHDSTENQLVVQVADSGKGIEANKIPTLCNQFGKLLRTAEMNSDGIGLGLMISKALIEVNEGKLYINSEGVQKGSVFTFTMRMYEISETVRSYQLYRGSKLKRLRSASS